MSETPKCETCRHWQPPSNPVDLGHCEALAWPGGTVSTFIENCPPGFRFGCSRHFGCALHAPEDEKHRAERDMGVPISAKSATMRERLAELKGQESDLANRLESVRRSIVRLESPVRRRTPEEMAERAAQRKMQDAPEAAYERSLLVEPSAWRHLP